MMIIIENNPYILKIKKIIKFDMYNILNLANIMQNFNKLSADKQ